MRSLRKKRPRITLLDVLLFLLILAAGAWFVIMAENRVYYRWNWAIIPQYLFRFDEETERWAPNLLMQGLLTTLRLSLWSIALATLIGTVAGLCRVSRSLFRRLVGRTYVELIRNLPPLVLVFIFYFFVSSQIMPVLGVDDWIRSQSEGFQRIVAIFASPPSQFVLFCSGVATLALYEGAYVAEIVRAGIQSVEQGQWEASSASGLSRWQQMRCVVMPQAVQSILPPLAGQFISTIKDSAIVSVISIRELTFQGTELMAATHQVFEVWITIVALYFVLTFGCSLAVGHVEKAMRRKMA